MPMSWERISLSPQRPASPAPETTELQPSTADARTSPGLDPGVPTKAVQGRICSRFKRLIQRLFTSPESPGIFLDFLRVLCATVVNVCIETALFGKNTWKEQLKKVRERIKARFPADRSFPAKGLFPQSSPSWIKQPIAGKGIASISNIIDDYPKILSTSRVGNRYGISILNTYTRIGLSTQCPLELVSPVIVTFNGDLTSVLSGAVRIFPFAVILPCQGRLCKYRGRENGKN